MPSTSLADHILLTLHDGIIAGKHAADKPIRQDTVALELGVSKIPVREALNRLEREGLIVSHPNRGFLVRRLTRAEAVEILDIRISLEGRLLAEALGQTAGDQREAVLKATEAAGVTFRPGSPSGWPECFLTTLAGRATAEFTRSLVARLWSLSEHFARSSADEGAPDRAAAYRRSLLVAWRSGRPAVLARAATRGLTAERDLLKAAASGAIVAAVVFA